MLTILSTTLLALSALPQQHPEDGRGQALFDKDWHVGRRAALLDFFADKDPGVIVLRGKASNPDYREFRQDNNFWYFTGVTTPNAVLVMTTDDRHQILLVPPSSADLERWMGDLIDPTEAREITGIEDTRVVGQSGGFGPNNYAGLTALLDELSEKYDTFYVQRQPAENWMMSRDNLQGWAREQLRDPFDGRKWREGQFFDKLKERYPDDEVKDISVTLDGLRVIKTEPELEAMRRAAAASGRGHEAVMTSAMPGDYEWQLASRMAYEFREAGGMGQGAYAPIVGSGISACTLHYNENKKQLAEGEVVMIDYGAEYNHYVADISRTWPVGRTWSERERYVYQAVYDAQEAAFAVCKPGSTQAQVHAAARRVLEERGLGDAFWHSTCHWLGMATHDVGMRNARLEPGMVFTVEPGAYLPEEGIGVRIEDVVLITEDGYELISSMIPRDADAIEKLRAQAWDAAEATPAVGR
jgi:Xaa-Pro aminopeptidase